MKFRISRRRFVKTATAVSTAFPLFTISGTKASGRVIGANDTIRIGVCGIHGQGQYHAKNYARLDNVEVGYLIDPDKSLFDSRSDLVESRGGNRPKCVQDVRHALDDPNLDAVSVATCNHWHSLITIWACQAGKDVYVEKPLSHNVFEGRKCVEAARKYDRVVQHGTQNRADLRRAREIAAVQSGRYGKLLVSKGYASKGRWSIGFKPNEVPPSYVDFNLWLGPAAETSFHRNLVHYNWHWFWNTGSGEIGNQGVHQIDIARWAIKDATLPKRVWSLGGRFAYKDQAETPNSQISVFDYGDTLLLFEVLSLCGKKVGPRKMPSQVINEYYMTEGKIREARVAGERWPVSMFYPKEGGTPERVTGGEHARVAPGGEFGGFVNAMRTRRPEDNNADVLEAHYSAALCHLANISYRLGDSVAFNAEASVDDNGNVKEMYENLCENLQGNGVEMNKTRLQWGRTLEFDPDAERFVDNDEANALLTRKYRKPFVVPTEV